MNNWISALAELQQQGEPCVLVTIIEERGSTPRNAGSKMVVSRERLYDTIGGGLYVNADDVSVLGNLFTDNHAGVAGGAAGLECFSGLGAVGNNTVVGNTVAFGQANRTGGITVGGSCLWEVANKADIYEAYRGYKAFIERA